MLRLNTSASASQLGLGGDPVPCVQCERREIGLAWGDYCSVCKEERRRIANGRAQRAAIVAAVLLAAADDAPAVHRLRVRTKRRMEKRRKRNLRRRRKESLMRLRKRRSLRARRRRK